VNSASGHRGFTLLELLVATAMTAVLAGSLYATLHAAFKARSSAVAVVARARRAEAAFEIIRADLASAVVPKGILAGPFLGADGVDTLGRPDDALALYTAASAGGYTEGAGDIRMVELLRDAIEDGEGGEQPALLRLVTRDLLATTTPEPDEQVLCRDVAGLDLRYFDGMDWRDDWDSTAIGNVLPAAVEVTIGLLDEQAPDGVREITRIFPLPCSSIVPGMQVEAPAR